MHDETKEICRFYVAKDIISFFGSENDFEDINKIDKDQFDLLILRIQYYIVD